jgi:hypothetical protein
MYNKYIDNYHIRHSINILIEIRIRIIKIIEIMGKEYLYLGNYIIIYKIKYNNNYNNNNSMDVCVDDYRHKSMG